MSVAAVTAGPKRGWRSVSTWIGALIVCAAAFAACRAMWRHVAPRWAELGAALAQGGTR